MKACMTLTNANSHYMELCGGVCTMSIKIHFPFLLGHMAKCICISPLQLAVDIC